MAKLTVNMRGVGNTDALPEGEYEIVVDEVTTEEGENYPYLRWVYRVADGEYEGRKLFDNTSLAPKALWRLRGVLVAMGVSVPQDEIEIDTDAMPGSRCACSVIHEKYKGRPQAKIAEFFPSRSADGGSEDATNLDALSLSELVEYANSKAIDLTGVDTKKRVQVERAIQEAA